ncbi:MAG: helix-turn-helix domain-containing protein [Bacteroidetes bacterium]|nr:helix-turn-helix domain-containing protein [Bacteroidota bacterium]
MIETFINKIRLIVLKNIENDAFGVSELASELGFSRSQILRKVKTQTRKSANQLIREIRLEEAVKLLKEGECTASEIAYKVGFSSPSYFNKCFLDQYGFTPGEYKNQNSGVIDGINLPNAIKPTPSKILNRVIFSTLIVVILIFAFLFREKADFLKGNSEFQEASIAVLPLLDLSEKKDKEYLAVGLTDAITLELSKLKGLRVISRGSAMMFQDSTKLYSEIAKKLGVDLLLEGSVIYSTDSLRVIVQLIEPFPKERHLWAKKYDQNSSNIFHLADDISSQIAKKIHLVVSPEVAKNQVKQVDPKAYELYLRGKYLWYQQNTAAMKNAIKYLKESIEIDSSYAPAYSTLAEAYISINKFILNNEEKLQNRVDSRKAINNALNKAIELDGSLGDAFITRGNILGKFDWDWEGMKKMAEKGLQLNPNNSYGYILLSNYHLIKGDLDNALNEALVAEKLDPLNPRTGCLVAETYFMDKQFEKSINQYNKVLELFPGYGFAWDGIGYAQFNSGQREVAMRSWGKLHVIMGNNDMAEYFKANAVEKALNHWIELAIKGESLLCSNPTIIAQAQMFVNEKEGALEYLELAFEVKNEDLPIMLQRPHFFPLHDEPRFKELVKKVGVTLIQ